jgi:hypothetical protein
MNFQFQHFTIKRAEKGALKMNVLILHELLSNPKTPTEKTPLG